MNLAYLIILLSWFFIGIFRAVGEAFTFMAKNGEKLPWYCDNNGEYHGWTFMLMVVGIGMFCIGCMYYGLHHGILFNQLYGLHATKTDLIKYLIKLFFDLLLFAPGVFVSYYVAYTKIYNVSRRRGWCGWFTSGKYHINMLGKDFYISYPSYFATFVIFISYVFYSIFMLHHNVSPFLSILI